MPGEQIKIMKKISYIFSEIAKVRFSFRNMIKLKLLESINRIPRKICEGNNSINLSYTG